MPVWWDAMPSPNFNCTIQELKREKGCSSCRTDVGFQLHHTGIKTHSNKDCNKVADHFNCTIQELKRALIGIDYTYRYNFNCTIQELKPKKHRIFVV